MRIVIALLCVVVALPAQAHTQDAQDEWVADWYQRVEVEVALTPELLTEYLTFMDRHEPIVLAPQARSRSYGAGVEQWRGLVETYFQPEDVPWAMRVMWCESKGDPNAKNPRSSASGLFQHLATYWPERSAKAGWAGASIFDPEANIAVAAWLYSWGGSSHWVCK